MVNSKKNKTKILSKKVVNKAKTVADRLVVSFHFQIRNIHDPKSDSGKYFHRLSWPEEAYAVRFSG